MSLSPSSASPNPVNNNDTTTTSKRARLEAFYQKYAPREMYKVDHAMKLSMPEEELFQALRERYNVPTSTSPTTTAIEKSAETLRPSSLENNQATTTTTTAASYNANLLQQSHHQAQSSSSLASSTSTLRPQQQQQQQPSASIIAALQQQQKEEFVYPNHTVVVPPGSSPARNIHFDHHSHSSHNQYHHQQHHRHSTTYSATASMMNQQQDVFHDNNYNDDDNFNDEEHQHLSPDSPHVRSDAALRHDVLKVLIATQRAEAENRTRMLERKTFLTRYCTILLRWMEFTTHKISQREKEMMSKKDISNSNQNESSSAKDTKAILQTGISPTRTSPRNTAAVTSTSPSSQLKPTDEVPFTAVPPGTLHSLRRQWQQRVASILQRRSFFILQQRSLDKWRLFATKMGGNKQAYQAIASSESALLVSKRKRRQVILNSVEMQRTRAMRTLGSSFFFKWRLATSQKVNSVKRVELLQKEAQAKALILAEKELRRRQSEDEEHQSKMNQPPQSLESLVQALTGPNNNNNNNNNNSNSNIKNDDQSSSSGNMNNNTVAIRPAFFHPPDSNLDFSPPRTLNAASEIQMKETSRTLKIQLTRIRSEMTKMKSEIRQASNYIATECSQWEMKFKKKFGSGSNNSNREMVDHISSDDSKQKRGVDDSSGSTPSAAPPTWQYERSILQRRAAAYDTLLEDHRLLQESLQAAEEDIARLRSLALLREMHSSPQAALVHATNHNNNLSTSSRSASASGGVMMDRLGLSTTPRITMNPPIAALPLSVGRDRYDTYNHHQHQHQQQRSFSALNNTNNQNTTTDSSVSRRFAANYHHRDPHQPQVNSPGHAQVPPENLGVSCFTL